MIGAAAHWQLSVNRGPDWLFVELQPSEEPETETADLAANLWALLAQHFTYRLVLEMDAVEQLPSEMIGQLITLERRLAERGGKLRLCGLSDDCQKTLRLCQIQGQLATHGSRLDAVLGHHPAQPK